MAGTFPALPWKNLCLPFLALFALLGCSATGSSQSAPAKAPAAPPALTVAPTEPAGPIMLGIDVLESQGFAALKGKRVGLLTMPAGVNRQGVSTIEVLRRAPGVQLAALFAIEHGINNEFPAGKNFEDYQDPRTGLPVHSLYDGKTGRPTKAQLKGIDVLVVDLQDIGVRSYTHAVRMRYAIEGCFQNGVEVIVLDRPNPLGGLKVDGPILDADLKSGVGGFRVPYVHGLTIGELARMAAQAPGVLDIPEAVRAKGKLTVIPMRGWNRAMLWPETGLRFVPTSPRVQDFAAVVGYAMVGLGCEGTGFTHGIGTNYNFRGIAFKGLTTDQLLQQLTALRVPGVGFRKLSVTDAAGKTTTGVYVDVNDWQAWNPTQLSFELMRLACRLTPPNPVAKALADKTNIFNKLVGSHEFLNALQRDGAKLDLEAFEKTWQARNAIYQQQTKKYWLYN
jgi:uncharacterized protein YbbC (DUF1343 family)